MTTGTLITVVPTGARSTKAAVPALPVDPTELITTAQECEALGASVITVHARDETGEPSRAPGLLRALVRELRAVTDLVIQLATSGAGEESAADQLGVLDVRPEMASCPLGSPIHTELHIRMRADGIVAGYEVTTPGQIAALVRLLDRHGLPVGSRPHLTLLMGGPGGMPGTAADLVACQAMIRDLPPGTSFSAAGLGDSTLPVMLASLATGGHLRVGLADTTVWSSRQAVDSNMQLVARAVGFAQLAQRPPLTTKEAREVLGVSAR